MDYRIFNVRTDVNACDCTRGCTDTGRESALKVDPGRKIPCRIGESNLCQRRVGSTLYRLSYIPVLFVDMAGRSRPFRKTGFSRPKICFKKKEEEERKKKEKEKKKNKNKKEKKKKKEKRK